MKASRPVSLADNCNGIFWSIAATGSDTKFTLMPVCCVKSFICDL